ncbi:hypothetical protein RIR_jg28290.t1 [Rhizophagus irregularis DAOM 181602=DAOM 197198]|nr:hypothetical protein RIR_jg28290.t1 [Rhizophagus irregularis DAOM 181602=DAOM 197198]
MAKFHIENRVSMFEISQKLLSSKFICKKKKLKGSNSYELISNGVPVFRLRQQMQQSIEIHPIWDHNSRFCTRFGRNEYNLK